MTDRARQPVEKEKSAKDKANDAEAGLIVGFLENGDTRKAQRALDADSHSGQFKDIVDAALIKMQKSSKMQDVQITVQKNADSQQELHIAGKLTGDKHAGAKGSEFHLLERLKGPEDSRNAKVGIPDALVKSGHLSADQGKHLAEVLKDPTKLDKSDQPNLVVWKLKHGSKPASQEEMAQALYPQKVNEESLKDARQYQRAFDDYLTNNGSLPVQRGEGYHQLAKRMSPRGENESERDHDKRVNALTKNLKDWNGGRALKEGELLRTWSPEDDEKRIAGPFKIDRAVEKVDINHTMPIATAFQHIMNAEMPYIEAAKAELSMKPLDPKAMDAVRADLEKSLNKLNKQELVAAIQKQFDKNVSEHPEKKEELAQKINEFLKVNKELKVDDLAQAAKNAGYLDKESADRVAAKIKEIPELLSGAKELEQKDGSKINVAELMKTMTREKMIGDLASQRISEAVRDETPPPNALRQAQAELSQEVRSFAKDKLSLTGENPSAQAIDAEAKRIFQAAGFVEGKVRVADAGDRKGVCCGDAESLAKKSVEKNGKQLQEEIPGITGRAIGMAMNKILQNNKLPFFRKGHCGSQPDDV